MVKKLLLFSLLVLLSVTAKATHIVGGEITYQHLGGASYKVDIKLYRDCCPSCFAYPNYARLEVRRGNGTSPTPSFYDLPRIGIQQLDPPLDTCAFDPGICVEEAIYSAVISLPPGTGGYHLFHGQYARNNSLLNITSPGSTGEQFYAYIPDNNLLITNSSPVFSNFPPVFVCLGNDLDLDLSATDVDGDSLVYSFYRPYNGRRDIDGDYTTFWPTIAGAGTPPDNITFPLVNYSHFSYSATNPINLLGTPLNINANTGYITGVPEQLGQYVVGVMVEEYRDGVKIGRIVRDFQFNVVACPPPQQAGIGDVNGCAGLAIDFINESGSGANGFWWNFGTGNPADTSIVYEPSFAYPSLGTYNVTLMAQKGTSCADTAYYTLIVSGLTPNFSLPASVCIGELAQFNDLSVPAFNGNVNAWEWHFGDGSTSTLQNPTHTYGSAGTFDVMLYVFTDVGCVDSMEQSIIVETPPPAVISALPTCNDLGMNFTNASPPESSGFWWSFGTGFPADTSIVNDPSFTYTSYGTYNIMLVAQKGTACADTTYATLQLTQFIPDFDVVDTACTNTILNYTDETTVSNGVVNGWTWSFGDGGNAATQNPTHGYSSPGDYDIKLVVTSDLGCIDSITIPIHIKDGPVAQIGPFDVCSGLTIDFTNNSDPLATGFWWGFGTGNPADSSIVYEPTFTFPSFGTYNVTLIAQKGTDCESTDNIIFNISQLSANFSFPTDECVGNTLTFIDGSTSSSPITIWEWDFGDLTTSLNQNETHTYATGGTYDVQLVVQNSVGCFDTLINQVNIQELIVVNSGLDTAVCVATPSLQLNGNVGSATGGIWSGNGGAFTPNATTLNATYNPSVAEINAGFTTLTLTSTGNGFCDGSIDQITIYYLGDPDVNAGLDIEVCEDSAFIDISASLINAISAEWTTSGDGTFGNEFDLNTTYTPSADDKAAGIITLYIETFNNSGCPNDIDSIYLIFSPAPTINVVTDASICSGYNLVLESNSSTGLGWWETLGDGNFVPEDTAVSTIYQNGPNDAASGSVIIVFHSLNNGGCNTLYDTLTVSIIDAPIVDFSSTFVCVGGTTSFTDLSTSIETITDWEWTFEPSQNSTNQNPTYTFSGGGIYQVQLVATSTTGCTDTLVQDVQVYYLPQAGFVSPEPCVYGAAFNDTSFVLDGTIESWSWNFGDGGTDNVQNPIHPYLTPGNYNISLTVTSSNGCVGSTIVNTEIFPGPNANFSVNPTTANVFVDIQFTDLSSSPTSSIVAWNWDFQTGDFSSVQNPIYQYDDSGIFNVMLIITDNQGCIDTAYGLVNIMHGPKVPAAFSPNGDGNNDFAMILGGVYSEIEFKIYNNWGEVIYFTNDPDDLGWDGTIQGVPQPMGVYVYTAVVTTIEGEVVQISGDITLIR